MDETASHASNNPYVARFQTAIQDSRKFVWSEFAGPRALRCLPAIIVPLSLGIVYHKPIQSLLAAAAAMSVGFGSFQRLYQSRVAPMFLATFSMGASAFIGTTVRHWDIAVVFAVLAWGFLRGLSGSIGPGAIYIGTQSIVFLLLSTGLAVPNKEAFSLVGFVLGAGLLQTGIITLFRLFHHIPDQTNSAGTSSPMLGPVRGARLALHTVRRVAIRRRQEFWTAVRISLTIGVSAMLSMVSHDHHRYWMPMTTAIILQQDMHQTFIRALSRIAGTLVGVAIATAVAAIVRPEHIDLIVLVAVFAWMAYSTLRVNYFMFAAFITAYIVFLLAFAGLPELSVIWSRSVFTLLGAIVALCGYIKLPGANQVSKV